MRRAILVAVAGMLSAVLAFRAPVVFPCRRMPGLNTNTARLSMSNVVDGIKIDGELKPLSNFVLVKVKKAESQTIGGIVIPDSAKEKPTEGRVIATGPGREHPDTGVRMEMPVKVGEGVVYGKYDGSSIKYNDETHTLIRDDDILLFFRGESLSVESAKPCRDHILVRVSSKEDKSMGGLIMAAAVSADKRPDTGIVVKVGKGRQASNGQFMNPDVKEGDSVRFRDYAGSEIKIEGVEYVVVRVYDILCKW